MLYNMKHPFKSTDIGQDNSNVLLTTNNNRQELKKKGVSLHVPAIKFIGK